MTNDAGPGSTSNVLAALASFFLPGLGQLVQGRVLAAAFFFVVAGLGYLAWFLVITWIVAVIVHFWAIVDAAVYRPRARP